MFFDSHCHLDRIDLTEYNNNFSELVSRSREAKVSKMICIGVDLDSFEAMHLKILKEQDVYCSVGVHPDYQQVTEPTVEMLTELAVKEKVVAIGETGLDYKHAGENHDWQQKRFQIHIEAARQSHLPLIIHTRDARKDTIQLMKNKNADEVGGVLHCFTENWEMARQAIEMGFYISISGIVTFKQAESIREMAKKIPDDRLLIETDSPWLSPAPFRGKTNFPGRVALVAETLAKIRHCSVEHIAQVSHDNACQLFNIH